MSIKVKYAIVSKTVSAVCFSFVLTACSSAVTRTELQDVSQIPDTTPAAMYDPPTSSGVVPMVWEPPIVDVVDVPPGLDPEGHYYRPAHQEIVEIRPGRWQYYGKK